jgi:hypothetical protein
MAVKATWLFNGFSSVSGRAWGFSETWYSGLTGAALIAAMDLVSAQRRLILASDASIVGYRIGVDNGRSYVVRRDLQGRPVNTTSNLPVDCALCEVGVVGAPTIKRFFFHDLPDDWVQSTNIVDRNRVFITNVVDALTQLGFQVRLQNPLAIQAPILSIDAAGNVVTTAPIGLAANNLVAFLTCRDTNGRTVRGQYIVDTVTDATHFKVAQWSGQVVSRKGRVRLVSYLFLPALNLGVNRTIVGAASRKAGRPFFQSRGRVPVRR